MIHGNVSGGVNREVCLSPPSKIGDTRAHLCTDEKCISGRGEIDVIGAGE